MYNILSNRCLFANKCLTDILGKTCRSQSINASSLSKLLNFIAGNTVKKIRKSVALKNGIELQEAISRNKEEKNKL